VPLDKIIFVVCVQKNIKWQGRYKLFEINKKYFTIIYVQSQHHHNHIHSIMLPLLDAGCFPTILDIPIPKKRYFLGPLPCPEFS
jgi:hypothetical protein